MVIKVFLILIGTASALLTRQPIWVTSSYFRAGNQDVISTLTGNSVTPTFTFLFSSALSGVPLLGYGLKAYQGSDYFGQQRFQVNRTALTESTFTVAVQIVGVTNIWNLNVAYIAIDPQFPHQMNSFDNVPISYQSSLVNVTSFSPDTEFYRNVVNFTEQSGGLPYNKFSQPYSSHKILLFMTSIYITATLQADYNDNSSYVPLQILVTGQIVDEEQYSMQVQLGIDAALQKLHFSQIFFNQQDVQSSLKYVLVYQKLYIDNIEGELIPIPEQFIDNFILGFTDFKTPLHRSMIDFKWNFATIDGVFGVQVEPAVGNVTKPGESLFVITQIGFTMLYIKTWQCPQQASFFDTSTQLCTQCAVQKCNICQSLTTCRECDWFNQYYSDPVTKICKRCQIGNGQCFDQETQLCSKCTDYTAMEESQEDGYVTFLVNYQSGKADEILSGSRFIDPDFTSFTVVETETPGVYRIVAAYEGDMTSQYKSLFILPDSTTYHISYQPNRIILTPEPQDLSIFIAIGTALALLGCCCICWILCIKRRRKQEKKKKKKQKKPKKNQVQNEFQRTNTEQNPLEPLNTTQTQQLLQNIESTNLNTPKKQQKAKKKSKSKKKKQKKNKKIDKALQIKQKQQENKLTPQKKSSKKSSKEKSRKNSREKSEKKSSRKSPKRQASQNTMMKQ